MPARATPPFRADHVGSLIRPDRLIAAWQAAEQGDLTAEEFTRIQHDAIREVVRLQEDIGLRAITDGEYNRTFWQRDFLLKLGNVRPTAAKMTVHFHTAAGSRERTPSAVEVIGKLTRPRGIFVDDFKFLKTLTSRTAKTTIPSPSTLHFRGGRHAIDTKAYPDIEDFYRDLANVYREEISDLAAAGCRYLQIDEVNLAYLCDPQLHGEVRALGEDPATLPRTYARIINDSIAGKPGDMIIGMHLCRGNFAGAWVAEGGYDPIAELLFNEIAVDGYFLEYDSPRAGSFAPLRFLPKGKITVLGLITTKSPALESKDEIKRRIEEASRYVPIEQLALSPQCGFSSGIGGNTMDVATEVAKLELVVDVAREVWGEA
jgi:5-methyltetrahydropteroyltriglutamate--homocysteine methyltransferase